MDSPEQIAAALADRYRLDREIGRGGMATVYLADDLKHGRKVAIKFMHPDLAAAIGPDRFLREIEIAARLTHPHILPLFDSGAVEGQLYYVTPYIEGESLRARLDREKQLPLDDALRLTREIASALNHAHRHGLIHRDIKPENVLLADGIALVADFGIARAARPAEPGSTGAATRPKGTTTGSVLGTPRYMSPEQATGGDVDARSDLYALGCVLYEMLAGVPPFLAPTADVMIRLHVTVAPRDITELRPSVPPGVAGAIMRALAKLPADRFAGMAQFAEAIAVGAGGGPTPTPIAESGQPATPHNLPRQRSRFIGRERELAECARLLGDTRLLTLTGVGGSGKTRLAIRLVEGMLDAYPDGVWFVDLAPVETEPLLAEVVAATLWAKGESGQTAEATIVAHLRGKHALLLLDNCEHLLGPTAGLADRLLGALPELKLVVTSREGLGIEGERLFAVRSLSLPRPGDETDLDALRRTEAVSLFVARARDVSSDFALERGSAGIVADICRRLDGIPLAIELAAARTRVLSVEQIARMLDDRFRLLTGGSRSVLERHRTLRATVQWSYDHLDSEEQALFLVLSVFAGGWTLDAAATVAGGDAFEVLDRLTHLIDKSLVVMERQGEARYRMLETLRQFGLELLASSGRADALRAAHFGFYLGQVRGMEASLRETFPTAAVRRLEGDVDNLRAALTWGFQHDPPGAVELTRRLERLWSSPGYYTEGRRWYAQTLALGDRITPRDRAGALARAGRLAFQQGDYEEALRMYEEGLGIRRSLGDPRRTARGLLLCGNIRTYLRQHDEAQALYQEALEIYAGLDDRPGMGRLETAIGLGAYLRGHLVDARRRFEAALEVFRPLGELNRIQVALGNLSLVDVAEGDAAAARAHLRECLSINRRVQNLYGIAHFLPALAETFRLEGDAATAARVIGATDALLERMGAALEALERSVHERTVAALRAEMGEEAFEAVRRDGRSMAWEDAIALAGA